MARNSRETRQVSGTPKAQGGLVPKAAGKKTAAATKPAAATSGESAGLGSAIAAMLGSGQPGPLAAPDDDGRPAPAGWLQAYIDETSPSRITGWLWDPQQPVMRIAVDVFDGDLRLMRVTADQYRGDLKRAGIGDGRHAFVIPLRPELLPNARNLLHLRVADTGAELPGSPITIDRAMPAAGMRPGLYEPAVPYVATKAPEPWARGRAREHGGGQFSRAAGAGAAADRRS
jgi:hypothetical protein